MDDSKLKRIIDALMNDNGKTPEEAATNRAKAAAILAKKGINLEDLVDEDSMTRETTEATRSEAIIQKFVNVNLAKMTRTKTWMSNCYTSRGRRSDRKKFHFAGLKPDVEWAEWLSSHIVQYGITASKGQKGNRAREDFLKAYAWEVSGRMQQIIDQMETVIETEGTGSDLIALNNAVDEYVEKLVGRLHTTGSRSSIKDANAMAAGSAAGKQVGFGRPVGGSNKTLAIGM